MPSLDAWGGGSVRERLLMERTCSYPNLLDLPLEMRRMIYGQLFNTKSSIPISDAGSINRVQAPTLLPINCLLASRQVHDEALDIIYRNRTFKVDSCEPGKKAPIVSFVGRPFVKFRKLEFEIIISLLHQFVYGAWKDGDISEKATVGHILHHYLRLFVEG